MTNKTRFTLSVIALPVSVAVFLAFTFIPHLVALRSANFIQGFAGGIALGTFLGVLHYARELKRERSS